METTREKLERCGACGAWSADPTLYTKEEQDTATMVHCGCEQNFGLPRYVTRDMAIDAGDPSLEGSIY